MSVQKTSKLEHLLLDWSYNMSISTKREKRHFITRHVSLLPFSIGSMDVRIAALSHIVTTIGYFVDKPLQGDLDDLAKTYRSLRMNKTGQRIHQVFTGLIAVGTYTILSYPDAMFSTITLLKGMNPPFSHVATELLTGYSVFELGRLVHHALATQLSYLQLDRLKFGQELSVYTRKQIPKSTSTTFLQLAHEIRDNPESAYSKYVGISLEQKITAELPRNKFLQQKLLRFFGDDPLVSYIQSKLYLNMGTYEEAFFEKAKEKYLEEKHIPILYLLAVDELLYTGSSNLFKPLAQLILRDEQLQRTALAQGTKDEVVLFEYAGMESTLVAKISQNFQGHKSKYEVHSALSSSQHVSRVFHLDQEGDESIIFEERAKGEFLDTKISEDPGLLLHLYHTTRHVQNEMEESSLEFSPINVVEEYICDPRFATKEIVAFLHDTEDSFRLFGEYKPRTDSHIFNLYEFDDIIVTADLENKGSGPIALEISNIIDFSYDHLSFEVLCGFRNTIFRAYQEEMNIDTPQLTDMYLRSALLRSFSYLRAHYEPGYTGSQPQLEHTLRTLHHFSRTSAKKDLAKQLYQVAESLI